MIFALRAFSLAFLAWHEARLFPGLAEPMFLAAAAVAGLAGGVAVRRLKWWLALPAAMASYAVVQLLLNVPVWLAGSDPSPLDQLPLWSERQFLFAAPAFALAWLEGWLFRHPDHRGRERLVNAAAATLVFWSQGPYHVTLYTHPLELALAFGLFLASELFLLAGKPPRPRGAAWTALLLVVVAGAAWLWSLLGRFEDQSTASGGGLMKPDLFQFDFAPLVKLEDEITLGENLVLLYREEGPAKARFLRRLVLDAYDSGQGFSMSGGKTPTVGRRPQQFAPSGSRERELVKQEYYLVNLDPSSLLALNDPVSLTPYAQWNHSSFVNAYRVESRVELPSFWLFMDQPDDGLRADEHAFFTRGGDDPEIKALALEVTRSALTPYDKAAAIEQYLRDHYYYSLKPGAPGPRGPLKHFLFEGKKGYCSYFAFAMTLMLRSLDVPARIAVGFATDPAEAVLGFTPVRAFQAHAWVEVPIGPYGWLTFDPTSSTPAPGEPFRFPKAADPQELAKMIAEILDADPKPLAEAPTATAPKPVWEQLWSSLPLWWLLPLAAVAANEFWRHRWRWARLWTRDPRRRAALSWAELAAHARRTQTGPGAGETPEAWADRIRARFPELENFAADVSRARYARELPPDLVARVAAAARTAKRRFDASRPAPHRILSSVFPWWPR
jgi:hypothetical protein